MGNPCVVDPIYVGWGQKRVSGEVTCAKISSEMEESIDVKIMPQDNKSIVETEIRCLRWKAKNVSSFSQARAPT